MAEQLDLEGLRKLKAEYPDHAVVAYINTTSELKTECDVCVTSSSANQRECNGHDLSVAACNAVKHL